MSEKSEHNEEEAPEEQAPEEEAPEEAPEDGGEGGDENNETKDIVEPKDDGDGEEQPPAEEKPADDPPATEEPKESIGERIIRDPLELEFREEMPEIIEFTKIPKINDSRSIWRQGMRKLEEVFAEHIANMNLDFDDKAN